MATMNRSNLAHGNTLMNLSATFPFRNGRPATTPSSEVPMVVDLRVTWSRFSNESSEIMHRSEEFIFSSTLGTILLPQARRREVSYMLSHVQHSDPRDSDFWINQICSFASQAAPEAVQNHGLVLDADIIIDYTDFHAFFEGIQEISEPLTLGEIFEGKEWFGNTPDGRSSGRKLEKAIYTADGFQESECVICLEKFDPGKEVAKMPCSHIFDKHCIVGWLERSPLCPLCRFEMPSGTGKGN
ncbi:RING-H2 finger protein ATL52-like [Phoenix dactylifera]|uniref:RING-H2 finger protein ATL52-like n=1 Tax=Phoenix dactylifera TaxID=42345 RepID=A0A8B7BY49_PHODC|nr:RING-H2 finger protein ATL52-like [Phoenix dactylifera]